MSARERRLLGIEKPLLLVTDFPERPLKRNNRLGATITRQFRQKEQAPRS
jgi:hypothetical protein